MMQRLMQRRVFISSGLLGRPLWIAFALVGWLRWGFRCFSAGELWRPLRRPHVEL